jgi:putative ABC transport system permease protein
LFRGAQADQELDEELRDHLERKTEEYVTQGMTQKAARRHARLDLDGVEQTKEKYRDARRANWIQDLVQDIRYGLRILRKNPGFGSTVILILGLGIGLNSAIFTVANGFLLREPPVTDPPTVVMVTMANPLKGRQRDPATPTEFLALQRESHLFDDTAALQLQNLPLTGRGDPESVTAARVTPNYFALLGVPARVGRTFSPDMSQWEQEFNAVISFDLWQRTFDADPGIIGKTLTVAGQSYTVMGVMPDQFKYAFVPCAVWIPDTFDVQQLSSTQNEKRDLNIFARLRSGTNLRDAQVQANAIIKRLAHNSPTDKGWVANVLTLQDALVEDSPRTAVLLLMGVVVFVLLIACANVAGMFLARYAGRMMEFSVRQALGAGRLRLIQQLLGESLLFAIFGGAFGLLLSYWGVHLLRAKLSFNAETAWLAGKLQVDSRVLIFTFVTSFLTVLLFGVLPALTSSKLEIHPTLQGSGGTRSQGRRESRLRGGFVVGQIALTIILIAAAGMSIQLVIREMRAHLGFEPQGVLSISLSLPSSKYPSVETQAAFFSELLQRIQALPGIQSVAVTQEVPESFPRRLAFEPEADLASKPEERPQAGGYFISPGYFRVMKIPVLKGRAFSGADSALSPKVSIVNESLAKQYFSNADPIGRFIRTYPDPSSVAVSREIVGVAADVIDRVGQTQSVPQIYVPFTQNPVSAMRLVLRVNGDPMTLAAPVRASVWAIDKDQPIGVVQTMTEVIGARGSGDRFLTSILTAFAGIALGLATIGIFGVVAYLVARRTHEIGVRIALGAQKPDIFRVILGRGFVLAAIGTAVGLIGSFVVIRIVASAAYSDSWLHGLLILGIAPAIVLLAALLASYIPARRAMRIDPMIALRYE